MSDRPVLAALRYDSGDAGHVRLSVFIGRNPGARGHSGTLTLRTDEWLELQDSTTPGRVVIEFELIDTLLQESDGAR